MYHEINESAARRAHENMSFSDYRPGSATASYRAQVDEAAQILERVKASCTTQAQRDHADHLFERYTATLAAAINKDNEIGTRCPSVMIAGPSNFPVRKKEKQVAAWDANRETYKKAEHYLDMLKSAAYQPIKSNDPEALDALTAKLHDLQTAHEEMKAANAYYRKHKTLDGCPGVSAAEKEWLTRPGVFHTGEHGTPLEMYGVPYPAYALQNSNANIKRLQERISSLQSIKSAETEDVVHNGYTYREDTEQMRVQLIFDDKPDEETRSLLKQYSFRWSPRNSAWQRQLTPNGKHAARQVMAILDSKQ